MADESLIEQMTGSPRADPASGLAVEDSGAAASNCGALLELVSPSVIVTSVGRPPASSLALFALLAPESVGGIDSLSALWQVRSASLHAPSTLSQTALRDAPPHSLFELHDSVHTPHKQLNSRSQSESEPHAASQLVLVSVGSVVEAPQPFRSSRVSETRGVL